MKDSSRRMEGRAVWYGRDGREEKCESTMMKDVYDGEKKMLKSVRVEEEGEEG
jgi:hypothetical protein